MVNRIFTLLMLIFAVTACGLLPDLNTVNRPSEPLGTDGGIVTINGEITGVVEQCYADGICAYIVTTDEGNTYRVIWAEGMMQCVGQWEDLAIGTQIEAYGEIVSPQEITICRDTTYYIRSA